MEDVADSEKHSPASLLGRSNSPAVGPAICRQLPAVRRSRATSAAESTSPKVILSWGGHYYKGFTILAQKSNFSRHSRTFSFRLAETQWGLHLRSTSHCTQSYFPHSFLSQVSQSPFSPKPFVVCFQRAWVLTESRMSFSYEFHPRNQQDCRCHLIIVSGGLIQFPLNCSRSFYHCTFLLYIIFT